MNGQTEELISVWLRRSQCFRIDSAALTPSGLRTVTDSSKAWHRRWVSLERLLKFNELDLTQLSSRSLERMSRYKVGSSNKEANCDDGIWITPWSQQKSKTEHKMNLNDLFQALRSLFRNCSLSFSLMESEDVLRMKLLKSVTLNGRLL